MARSCKLDYDAEKLIRLILEKKGEEIELIDVSGRGGHSYSREHQPSGRSSYIERWDIPERISELKSESNRLGFQLAYWLNKNCGGK